MKVHYTSSLWCKDKGACGIAQKINWQFEYLGLKRYIPCIYHFKKGIVFDLLTFWDENEIKAFYEKYEKIADKLTPLQQKNAEQEHPYQEISIKEIWIDGYKIEENYSTSACISIPFLQDNNNLSQLQKAYHSVLDSTTCFQCQRFCVPYPKARNTLQKFLRSLHLGRINTLKLTTYDKYGFYPIDNHFTLSDENSQKTVTFEHPITKTIHHLYFQLAESAEIPHNPVNKHNFYTSVASYEIEPPLQQNDHLQFDSSISYTSELINDFAHTASSIGVIGGSYGPTAIFLPGKGDNKAPYGPHGLPLHTCYSVTTMEKSKTSLFIIKGLNIKTHEGKQYSF